MIDGHGRHGSCFTVPMMKTKQPIQIWRYFKLNLCFPNVHLWVNIFSKHLTISPVSAFPFGWDMSFIDQKIEAWIDCWEDGVAFKSERLRGQSSRTQPTDKCLMFPLVIKKPQNFQVNLVRTCCGLLLVLKSQELVMCRVLN